MSNNFIIYLLILASVSAIGVYRLRFLSIAYQLLVLLVIFTFTNEFLSRFDSFKPYSSYLYWTYACVKIPALILILGLELKKNLRRKSLYITSFLVLLVCLGSFIYFRPTESFPSIIEMLTSPITVIACLVAYKDLLNFPSDKKLMLQPLFCLSTAIIIYTSITFTHISLYRYYLKHDIDPIHDGRLHTWITWLFYAFLGYILYIASSKERPNGHTI